MKLSRVHLIIINLIVVVLFVGINRYRYISSAIITEGIVVGQKKYENKTFPEDSEYAPVIEFYNDEDRVIFTADRNLGYKNGEVHKIIYKKKNPRNAKIYSFNGFWLGPLIMSIVPFIIISALIFGFMSKGDRIIFSSKGFKRIKNKKISKSIDSKNLPDQNSR
ncbi:MAG: hypothetical protein C0596_17995 [Marinilabiliales bacterium]|nr:MAG: hypothetical protein C0596_17995 [Marinilabiliales bacterium]